jgi:hypothetical protein
MLLALVLLYRWPDGLLGVMAVLFLLQKGFSPEVVGSVLAGWGIAATIVVPHGNSVEKNAAMRAFGAELVEAGSDTLQRPAGAGEHMVGLALAVRPVAAVGQVDEVLLGQFAPQGLQDAQAADAAVVDADHRCCAMGVIRLSPRPPGCT